MIIKEVLEKSILFLKNKNCPTPRLDSELLISHILKLKRMDLYLKFDKPLDKEEVDLCRDIIVERSKGIPVAYLVKEKGFYGLDFMVNSSVLVPRPETELLVEEVLNFLHSPNYGATENKIELLELGVGSGCISVSVAHDLFNKKNIKNFEIDAIDLSPDALTVAKENSSKILKDQSNSLIHFMQADAFQFKTEKKYDVIMSNPPYIAKNDLNIEKNVKDFEPHLALFAENNGLDCILNWFRIGISNLKPNGLIIFEIGSNQGHDTLNFVQSLNSFHDISIIKDYSGFDRFIKAVRNG